MRIGLQGTGKVRREPFFASFLKMFSSYFDFLGMNELCGLFYLLCEKQYRKYGELFKSDGNDDAGNEAKKRFNEINDLNFIEHDVYILFDLLMKAEMKDLYLFEVPGRRKKKRGTTRIYGMVQHESVRIDQFSKNLQIPKIVFFNFFWLMFF